MSTPVTTTDLSFLNYLQDVVAPARAFAAQATQAVRLRCAPDGRPDAALMQRHQNNSSSSSGTVNGGSTSTFGGSSSRGGSGGGNLF